MEVPGRRQWHFAHSHDVDRPCDRRACLPRRFTFALCQACAWAFSEGPSALVCVCVCVRVELMCGCVAEM